MTKKKKKEQALITDIRLFPRSEYYTRFVGTTAFLMDDPAYWGIYHRSEATRSFSEMGGRGAVEFRSPCVKKPYKTNSFFAHTGGIASPFSDSDYQEAIRLEKLAPTNTINVRDELLLYKQQIAELVVSSFEKVADQNLQDIKRKGQRKVYDARPIVFYENNYPCVLIKLPALNPSESNTEAAEYWAHHPKPFQRLLLASFIGLLNTEAMKAGIPIEMVIRSSFGHNLPSICETDNTFRINVGVIPRVYAELIGKVLHQLNQMIEQITDENALKTPFDDDFLNKVRSYNTGKLQNAIKDKAPFKKLIETNTYRRAGRSDEDFEKLYQAVLAINKKIGRKGSIHFVPVRLKGTTVWEVIREPGDTMGKSVLTECFRKNETLDWFANAVMTALETPKQRKYPIEFALYDLLDRLNYGDKATMDYEKIHRDLKKPKRKFDNSSFKSLYKSDLAFSRIQTLLYDALCVERPNEAIYAGLERAGADFFSSYKGNTTIQEESDYGSESEFSTDCSVVVKSERTNKKPKFTEEEFHLSHSKLRVCTGMKAIVLAHYAALFYLRQNAEKSFLRQDIQQMYYEVEDAIKMVRKDEVSTNKIKFDLDPAILHFDLNHCNAANAADNLKLTDKLTEFEPTIAILDYTSSTYEQIKDAIDNCFIRSEIKLVILVDSGLKNSQAGLDFNPYGEVRVLARDTATRENIIEIMEGGLSESDKSSAETHEMVRACKNRGLALSLYGFFETRDDRFQPVESPSPQLIN
jgi:hypothetical protein